MSASVTVTYCDDVRREEGGKLSYMGVYSAEMLLPSFPHVVPKLCVIVNTRFSYGEYPSEFKVKLFKGEELLAEGKMSQDEMRTMYEQEPSTVSNATFSVIGMIFVNTNISLTENTVLRVRGYLDDVEYMGNGLRVRSIDAVAPASPVAKAVRKRRSPK